MATTQLHVRRVLLLALALLLVLPLATPTATAQSAMERLVAVIVQAASATEAGAAVEDAGGRVTRRLPIVRGVSATVPVSGIESLGEDDRVRQVTENGRIGFEDEDYTKFTATPARLAKETRSTDLWAEGTTGRGVTVAVIDTGVHAAHPDLAGRVIHCEDFSAEAGTEAHCADTFGHGTFMAGLIAGNGASSDGRYIGTAPEANIVSVKLAGFDGSTDVSNVLAGIQWVVAHKDTYGIRVLNLSLGSDSSQTYLLSPLNYAVQKAWKSGISVVVSAGNSGSESKTILKPADDPYVITVGSSNDEGTLDIKDDRVPVFSSRGPTRSDAFSKPDVVAPGVHTVSLRSPGSAIDQYYGDTARVGGKYFRGTGTSMSAAVTSGVVAQMLQAKPSLTPDHVKYRLMSTARRIAETNAYAAGKGIVDAYTATKSTTTGKANQSLMLGLSTGLGDLATDRGTIDLTVTTPGGSATLSGGDTTLYDPSLVGSAGNLLGLVVWDGAAYTTIGWDATSWKATSWKLNEWAATSWKGTEWTQTWWDATSWKATSWKNADWEATSWKNVDWDATSWKATSWKSAWYAAGWE